MIYYREGFGFLWRRIPVAAGLLVAVAFAGGCAAFRPVSDVTRQYVLDPDAYEVYSAEDVEAPILVAIDRIDVPRYLEQSGIAVREERHRIHHSLNHRWAEPVEMGLARLLRENLVREAFIDHVFSRAAEPADLVLRVQVLRCEGMIDGDGSRGVLRASWEIRSGADVRLVRRGSLAIDDLPWDGENYGRLVEGLSGAANRLARDVAADMHQAAEDRRSD